MKPYVGQIVQYTHWGKPETSTIAYIGTYGKIVWLANGRWVHAPSLDFVPSHNGTIAIVTDRNAIIEVTERTQPCVP